MQNNEFLTLRWESIYSFSLVLNHKWIATKRQTRQVPIGFPDELDAPIAHVAPSHNVGFGPKPTFLIKDIF